MDNNKLRPLVGEGLTVIGILISMGVWPQVGEWINSGRLILITNILCATFLLSCMAYYSWRWHVRYREWLIDPSWYDQPKHSLGDATCLSLEIPPAFAFTQAAQAKTVDPDRAAAFQSRLILMTDAIRAGELKAEIRWKNRDEHIMDSLLTYVRREDMASWLKANNIPSKFFLGKRKH